MDRVHSRWGKLVTVKRHLLILLFLTVLIRGVMFVSYPLGGQDEGQGFYHYNIAQFLAGDWQIGNLRYGPGYTLLIAPISAIGDLFGRFDERIELLFQVVLSSTIPFLLYDILRTRHSPRAAFIVAILSLADPFGLQWAHFSLPVWLVALCLVFSLWLLHHAERRRSWRLVVAAGLVTGFGVLGRWNYAPVALGLGFLLLFMYQEAIQRRMRQFALFGGSAALLVLWVHVTVQVPATGVWHINCISGLNQVQMVQLVGIDIQSDNGPNSHRLLRLSRLSPLPQHETPRGFYPFLHADIFPHWQTPGSLATEAERGAFLSQNEPGFPLNGSDMNLFSMVNWLFFYLGPCELDQLLRGVFIEAVFSEPMSWLLGIPANAWQYIQPPLTMGEHPDFTLPPTGSMSYEDGGGSLGFQRGHQRQSHFYNGHWVWRPGIELFTWLWAPLNALRFLVFPALIWALFTRRWVYTACAILLLLYIFVMAAVDDPERRIYAIVYPLGPVLVGGFLLTCFEWLRAGRHS